MKIIGDVSRSKTYSETSWECSLLTFSSLCNGVVKSLDSGANVPHFESQSCQLVAVCDLEQVS